MAIYRKGQASMDGQGYITGYGTEWRTNLTLIRSGATIVFATNPISFATISEVINDTHMRAISTGGVTVERGDYVILLHDSLTVDGLAQDVAETLRYYQSKETQFEKFIDIIGDFDWDKLAESEKVIKENAAAAAASERNAKASETNAKTSETNSKASEQASKASQNAASASAGAAATSERNAKASETNSGANKDAAAASAAAAKASETNSASNKDAAAASAAAAKTSETNSASNKTAAAASAQAAKVSETNSASNKNAAAASASAAKTSETNAANSAKTSGDKATLATQQADRAKTEADRAADLATQLDATALMRKDANLSDVVSVNEARKNIRVEKLVQGTDRTLIQAPDKDGKRYALMIHESGVWGAYNEVDAQYIALPVAQGGTGSKDAAGARKNIGAAGLADANTFTQKQKFNGTIEVGSNAGNPLLIKSTNPCIRFEETDPPSGGATAYMLVMDGGGIRMQEDHTGASDTVFNYNSQTNLLDLAKARVRHQDGFTIQKTNDSGNAWLAFAQTNNTIRLRLGYEGDRGLTLHTYGSDGTHKATALVIAESGEVTMGSTNCGTLSTTGALELGARSANTPAYIDFQYGAKYDYDARIICDGYNSDRVGGGNLRFYSGYEHHNTKGSYFFEGGRLRIKTSDVQIESPTNYTQDITINSTRWNAASSDTVPQKGVGGARGIHTGVDSYDFNKACNINLYSWYSIGFCTAYGTPSNGIVAGKPAVMINTRTGDINAKGSVISKGVTLTCDRTQKSDIREIDDEYVLDRMCKVSNYTYRYNEGVSYTCGVMAQELEIWMPELVSKNESDNDALNVNHAGLVGYLHSCIRALKSRNDELEDRLKKVESYLAFKFPEDDI